MEDMENGYLLNNCILLYYCFVLGLNVPKYVFKAPKYQAKKEIPQFISLDLKGFTKIFQKQCCNNTANL